MRRALIVGVETYLEKAELPTCVRDAMQVAASLQRHEGNDPNFDCAVLAPGFPEKLSTSELRERTTALFAPGAAQRIFYFSGHGAQAGRDDVRLLASDASADTGGIQLSEILELAARAGGETLILLDCCFSGSAGTSNLSGASLLSPGISVLSACLPTQAAMASSSGSTFTRALVDGMNGGAADILGQVTIAGLFAYASESFGAWEQRPTFRCNLQSTFVVRNCAPAVPHATLRELPYIFPEPENDLPLDPSYEGEISEKFIDNPGNKKVFHQLQELRSAKLVIPVGEDHLYYAAKNSSACRLTPLGRRYWNMAKLGRI